MIHASLRVGVTQIRRQGSFDPSVAIIGGEPDSTSHSYCIERGRADCFLLQGRAQVSDKPHQLGFAAGHQHPGTRKHDESNDTG